MIKITKEEIVSIFEKWYDKMLEDPGKFDLTHPEEYVDVDHEEAADTFLKYLLEVREEKRKRETSKIIKEASDKIYKNCKHTQTEEE